MNHTDLSKTVIDTVAGMVRILAYEEVEIPGLTFRKEVLVNNDELAWTPYDEEYIGFLTLEEIAQQLLAKGYNYPFHVWSEIGLSGEIYMYGNYSPPTWVKHGTTKGYA